MVNSLKKKKKPFFISSWMFYETLNTLQDSKTFHKQPEGSRTRSAPSYRVLQRNVDLQSCCIIDLKSSVLTMIWDRRTLLENTLTAACGLSGRGISTTAPRYPPNTPPQIPTMLCALSQPGRHWSPICRQVKSDSRGLWETIDPACSTISEDSNGREINAAFLCYLCRTKTKQQQQQQQ